MYDFVAKGSVIDGVADAALADGAVAVKDGLIAYVGPAAGLGELPDDVPVYKAATVLPGFIDCHAHLTGHTSAGYLAEHAEFPDMLLGAAHEVGLLLDAGFTGVRDMSLQGLYLARAQERGILRSPRIMPGGRCLGVTAGHGDMFPFWSREENNAKSPIGRLCDGVDDCVLAVREQFRGGARFIKVLATGGVSSPMDDVNSVQFSDAEMQAIVDETRRHGTYVAAHCTGHEGAYQALKAGVTCIEHGVMLTEREVELMAQMDATLVTTLAVSLGCAKLKDRPEWFRRKAAMCAEANLRSIELVRKAGVRIALGTDFSNNGGTGYLRNGREFAAMVEAGMTPMEAIKAGTANGAYLMRAQNRTGTLEVGKAADLVLVDGDPLVDIQVLADAAHVEAVFMDGKKVK